MKLVKANPLLGLMFKKHIDYAVYFKTRLGIHTFFMLFPIDVVLLNEKREVVKIKENLKPWKVWLWSVNEYTVVEVPTGRLSNISFWQYQELS